MVLGGAFLSQMRRLFKGGANSSNMVNLVLIVHDKKTRAMILGNPFQELVLHTGDSANFFKINNFSLEFSYDSRHNLHKSQALQKKQNSLNRLVEREWPLPAIWQVP